MRPSPIEAARARHSLAEVARRTGIGLYRAFGSVTVRCPFGAHGHFDRSPSLRLHLDDGIWHCYGCARTGDVVEWVCQSEGVTWPQAIAILDGGYLLTNAWADHGSPASSRDVSVPHKTGRGVQAVVKTTGRLEYPDLLRTSPDRVFAAVATAWSYYCNAALHERGATYLRRRGIDVSVLEAHAHRAEVGHTSLSPEGLVTLMRRSGFTAEELVDSGLAHRSLTGRVTDFYRQRVLIPVRDDLGRICGFVGRNVGGERWPKYKNPPRTHAYDKSVNLYRPLPAPVDCDGQVIVVEGTLDAMAIAVAAIRSGRAGKFCPVTQSGRELSAAQQIMVLELCPNPLCVTFDGDAPGRESAGRLAQRVKDNGRAVTVVNLPDGHDPASWLTAPGNEGLERLARLPDICGAHGSNRAAPEPVAPPVDLPAL